MSKTSHKLFNVKNNKIAKQVKDSNISSTEELLMLEAPKETDEIFTKLNIPSLKQHAASKMKDGTELNLLEGVFEGLTAFKGSHIKKLACSHNLQILPLHELKSYLGEEAALFILNFSKKFDKTMLVDSRFFILCDKAHFQNIGKGKEVKTFIIFYKGGENDGGRSYARILKKDTIIQLHSSGNDFSDLGIIRKYFSPYRHTKGDGMTRLYSNSLLLVLIVLAIIASSFGMFWGGFSLAIIYFIIAIPANIFANSEASNSWNRTLNDYINGY